MSARGDRPLASIVYRHVPQYRREFYERLRGDLDGLGIELALVHGQPVGADAVKRDAVRLPWATEIRNRSVAVAGSRLIWQPAWTQVRRADLVVVEQATKLPLNYLLLAGQRLGGPRVGLWGHGVNLQADDRVVTRAAEAIKRRSTRAAHWFFAYTEGVARRVRDSGFPADRITVVQNALDTDALRRWYAGVTDIEVGSMRRRHGITGARTGLFVGALYREKRLAFLLEAAVTTRAALGDFELIVAGTGPDAGLVEAAARRHRWIHPVGPAFGREKAVLGRLAEVMLMPGLVGLAVLDSFAFSTPMVTTAVPYHSPEIEYLRDGVNGVILPAAVTPAEYGLAVAALLTDPDRAETLRRGCRDAAGRYTVAEMSGRCAGGIAAALARPAEPG